MKNIPNSAEELMKNFKFLGGGIISTIFKTSIIID